MKVYINNDYRCYVTNNGTMREVEVPDFDGKCPAYIEGTRYIPPGETWTRSDGVVFTGEMTAPCIDSRIRKAYQAQYEALLPEIQVREAALAELGVTADD